MTHTKGHWHVGQGNGEGAIFADEGRMRMTDKGTSLWPICTMNRGWNDAEDDANARLVAAAPDLLEALQNAHALLQATLFIINDNEARGIAKQQLDANRAAIAKATGGAA